MRGRIAYTKVIHFVRHTPPTEKTRVMALVAGLAVTLER